MVHTSRMHAKRDALTRDVKWEEKKHCNGHYDAYNQTKSNKGSTFTVADNMLEHVSGKPPIM